MFDAQWWDERYGGSTRVWSGNPNPQLVAELTDVPPGTALDVGCGEGADALWLAARGWRVTAVDWAATALERGAAHAADLGAEIAGRVRWRREDLLRWTPDTRYDLVSAQFMQLPPDEREPLFARLAGAVAEGGTLLIVAHDPTDLDHTTHRPPREMFYPAEEVAAALDPAEWRLVVVDRRPRTMTEPDGAEVIIHDAVLRARRISLSGN